MKKTLIHFFAALFLMAPLAALAQVAHFDWAATNGAITINHVYFTSYFTHPAGPITIPSSIEGLPVTSLGDDFSGEWGLYLTSITIPATVTNIGAYAFEDDAYLTSIYFEGSPPAVGTYSFETHSQGNTTAYYLADADGWGADTNGMPTNNIFWVFDQDGVNTAVWTPKTGALRVDIDPADASASGAQWQLDGGPTYAGRAVVSDLVVGPHTISFIPVPGWTPPEDRLITVKYGDTAETTGDYKAWPVGTAPLMVQVTGSGVVSPNLNSKLLTLGKTYQMTATSPSDSIFSNWVASGSESFVSSDPDLKFTMQSNLVLQANFVPTPFATVEGRYLGLFQPDESNSVANCGLLSLNVTPRGVFSGYLQIGLTRHTLAGTFDTEGFFTNTLKTANGEYLGIALNVELPGGTGSMTGTVSGADWVATLSANQLVSGKVLFSGTGRFTIALTDSVDSTTGRAVMLFTKSGPTTLAGKLPSGTKFSVSSIFSPLSGSNAQWPFYTPLYGGKGCLIGWLSGPDGTEPGTVSGYFYLVQADSNVVEISASSQ